MGGSSSSPVLTTPWKEIPWGNKDELLQYVKNFQPQNKEVKAVRVLLCGPVGAGKSSFINSVNSVLQGRMTHKALASSTTSDQSFTKYQTYKIKKEGRGNFYPFVFNDVMGLEDGDGRGVRTDDIKLALKGHVMDGYKFNPSASLSDGDPGYISSPSINDRVHVLVYIYSANASEMKLSVLQKIGEIREAAKELGIPQLLILTHIDEACGETEKNLRNIYRNKHLKKKMTDFRSSLRILKNHILLVKNYRHEIQLDPDVDTLILNALRLMIYFGGSYAKNSHVSVPVMRSGASSSPLENPWRKISWENKDELLQYMKNFQPQNEEVKAIRVLLYSPVGAGKSSFINSVNNVLQGRMTNDALVNNIAADHSFTKKYQTYKIKKEKGNFYPFVFNDIMGLEDGDGKGVRTDDLKLAMKGHMKDGYKFNPSSPLSDGDPGYISSPSISDRVHVLVCIYSANASEMRSSVLQKMKEIREAASDLGIPQLAILTHIDAACRETETNIRNVYRSKYLKKKMTDFSPHLGIPMNCILPVKNYSHEIQLNPDIDALILSALRLMIDFGDDYANKL
ncbi:interferon-induced protein 44-like isoform X2 [Poecilia latipinna]|uniref:interferon-induced protein 44-like isoform X2 n=1 Tax=Poecilia latipinna TaxID=48699 RepID=UPI00072DA9A9|nr:PREDICTED: interferon-induced protein 44-like isoform X2 [Poecilia latipinna]